MKNENKLTTFEKRRIEIEQAFRDYHENPSEENGARLHELLIGKIDRSDVGKAGPFVGFFIRQGFHFLIPSGDFDPPENYVDFCNDAYADVLAWLKGETKPRGLSFKFRSYSEIKDNLGEAFRELERYLRKKVDEENSLRELRRIQTESLGVTYTVEAMQSLDDEFAAVGGEDFEDRLADFVTEEQNRAFRGQVPPLNQTPEEFYQGKERRQEIFQFPDEDIHDLAAAEARSRTARKMMDIDLRYPHLMSFMLHEIPVEHLLWEVFAYTATEDFIHLLRENAVKMAEDRGPFPSLDKLKILYLFNLVHKGMAIGRKKLTVRALSKILNVPERNLYNHYDRYLEAIKGYETDAVITLACLTPIIHEVEICFEKVRILEIVPPQVIIGKRDKVSLRLENLYYRTAVERIKKSRLKEIDELKRGRSGGEPVNGVRRGLKGDCRPGKLEPTDEKEEAKLELRKERLYPRYEDFDEMVKRQRRQKAADERHERWRLERTKEDKMKRREAFKENGNGGRSKIQARKAKPVPRIPWSAISTIDDGKYERGADCHPDVSVRELSERGKLVFALPEAKGGAVPKARTTLRYNKPKNRIYYFDPYLDLLNRATKRGAERSI